jgi:3-dehydroquinate dehydratase-2
LEIFYAILEGEAINRIYQAVSEGVNGLVMNPAGFNYAGYALRDCVPGATLPYVEVHMTSVQARGIRCVVAPVANGVIFGLGTYSYVLGLEAMLHLISGANPSIERSAQRPPVIPHSPMNSGIK